MRDSRRPVPSVARLLIVALGLLGFVTGPAGAGAHGGTPSTGTISGARTAPVQGAPARTRISTKPRGPGRVQAVITAVALHAAGAAAPNAQTAHAALPASGIEVRPPAWRVTRPGSAHASAGVVPRGRPRGRAPPASTRI
ncbi:hypothetical protein ACQPZP_14335 [Spirillospora sp. CA-142024]|uniref:hypothetical protein n=1 Tax=Spirillospora sp. CA-142024 TaxID=3240036 RepID=UPI003D90A0A3